ncbi:hypothetical protein A2V94_01380 [Candidatus Atribacteria bacterium RBG_16_35_8]|nr:MAG: hypothetical protein A2V94_01380 [Candidatus Atribacteria bacterium RBG_16_35_8]
MRETFYRPASRSKLTSLSYDFIITQRNDLSITQSPSFHLYPPLLRGKGRVRVRHFLIFGFLGITIIIDCGINKISLYYS